MGYFSYILDDAPEYKARAAKPYTLPRITLKEIHDAVPKFAHERKTWLSILYVFKFFGLAAVFFAYATYGIPTLLDLIKCYGFGKTEQTVAYWFLWGNYWWWQSLTGGGLWTMAHEAGHSTLSPHMWVNHAIGYTLHTLCLVPYYGWRYSHNMHHKATNSIERDENFCPATRSDYHLPPPTETDPSKYQDVLDEAPIVVLIRLIVQQGAGLQAYLAFNAGGNRVLYPEGCNHYTLTSPLWKPEASKFGIIMSDIGIGSVLATLAYYAHVTSWANMFRMYVIPYVMMNHWIVLLVFLQHTDPTVPHLRKGAWTFLRGASCTVDRPLLGWQGRFFMNNISHDHVAHHFFSQMPFYHTPYATEAIRKAMGDDYNYDSTNTMRALVRNFRKCQFIEDTGDIVFYRDLKGVPTRQLDGSVSPPLVNNGDLKGQL